jgi:hypothetical protein
MNRAQVTTAIWFVFVLVACAVIREIRIRYWYVVRAPIESFLSAHITAIVLYLMPLLILLAGASK